MPIVGQKSKGVWAWGGDDGYSYTVTVNFNPGAVHAQVGFTEVDGGGLHRVGIKGYRYRPDPNGAEKVVDFGDWPSWKSIVGVVDQMSSVTWGMAVGADQEARGRLDIYWWG
jgi:hypothetical protein